MKSLRSISLLSAALLAAASAASAQVAANGRIAFSVCDYNPQVGTVCDIWTMNPDGTGQTNLTNTPAASESQAAWSADGARLAYLRDEPTGQVLVVVNADGSGATDITATPSLQNSPAWSPDGTKIAFSGVRFEQSVDPITGDPVTYAQWEIVAVNPDGSGEQILSGGDPGSIRATRLEEDRAPAWSPDSQSLVFMSQNVDPCCDPWQIWRVARDGTGVTLLSDNPLVNAMGPSFSPDGTLIVFSSDRDGGSDLYTIPASTGAAALADVVSTADGATAAAATPTRLTFIGNAADPAWGRDPSAPPPAFTLTVALKFGTNAGGLVASWPPGIFCGADCRETYAKAMTVLLVAVPKPGSRFTGWSGACTGRVLYCVVAVNSEKSVTAAFSRR